MVSSCPQMVSTDLYEGFEETVEDIHLPQLPAVAFQVRVLLAGGHLAAEPVVELFSGGPEVSEMQDETQEASATSSPDPLTLDGPEDRDIDLSHSLPKSAGSCEACIQNQPDVFREPPGNKVQETELVSMVIAFRLKK
jgi:hypothetical protein